MIFTEMESAHLYSEALAGGISSVEALIRKRSLVSFDQRLQQPITISDAPVIYHPATASIAIEHGIKIPDAGDKRNTSGVVVSTALARHIVERMEEGDSVVVERSAAGAIRSALRYLDIGCITRQLLGKRYIRCWNIGPHGPDWPMVPVKRP